MIPAGSVATDTIELVVFEHDLALVRSLVAHDVTTFLVDWEHAGKDARQQGFDTEIRPGTEADLVEVAAVPGAVAWCRVNRMGAWTGDEVNRAVAAGARGVFLPMVTSPRDVDAFLRILAGRAEAGILVETVDALACVQQLARYPLDRVYFGLNDFAISRGGGSIFRAVLDGSVARARDAFAHVRFGWGGLTAIDAGHPIPCRWLVEEMARLGCDFSFLRRSFRRDLATRDAGDLIRGVHQAWRECVVREPEAQARDHAKLAALLHDLS